MFPLKMQIPNKGIWFSEIRCREAPTPPQTGTVLKLPPRLRGHPRWGPEPEAHSPASPTASPGLSRIQHLGTVPFILEFGFSFFFCSLQSFKTKPSANSIFRNNS